MMMIRDDTELLVVNDDEMMMEKKRRNLGMEFWNSELELFHYSILAF